MRHGPGAGPWNMGVDEALLGTARGGTPSLRLYAWQGPWLSLGYAQVLEARPRAACAAAGVGVVRRATGGRAVLHGCDLTYAIAAPVGLVGGDVLGSSSRIARGLLEGVRLLGVEARCSEVPLRGARRSAGFDCFAAAGAHELLSGGRKLCGSAQRRVGEALLQHGSLRLRPEEAALRRAGGLEEGHATSLEELGVREPLERVAEALIEGLGRVLQASFEPAELSAPELRSARQRGVEPPLGLASRGP